MNTAFVLLSIGLLLLSLGAAEAAPTSACGEGGGVWDTVDGACASGGDVCVLWHGIRPIAGLVPSCLP